MTYTWIDQFEDNTYCIKFTDAFYNIFQKYYEGNSFSNILWRLYGLLPRDFYHYIGTTFNAYFKPSPYIKGFIRTQFKNKNDAIKFANDIDDRLSYLIKKVKNT